MNTPQGMAPRTRRLGAGPAADSPHLCQRWSEAAARADLRHLPTDRRRQALSRPSTHPRRAAAEKLSASARSPPKKLAPGTWSTGSASGKTCGARVDVVLLWGVATANQRRRPLLGCEGTAGGAGLVTQPPRGASGAARVRGRFPVSRGRVFRPREIDRAALPAQSRRLAAADPPPPVLGRSAWCSPRA